MVDFRILAESEDTYEWIGYLVFLFFIIVLPLLKKVGDAIAGKKGQKPSTGSPGQREAKPEQRGAMKEMLDEVEEFFRSSRVKQKKSRNVRAESGTRGSAGSFSPFEARYRDRKRELENMRRGREERLEQRRLDVVRESQARSAREAEEEKRRPTVAPVLGGEKSSVSDQNSLLGVGELSSLARERRRSPVRTADVRETSAFDWTEELPEAARMIVFSELLSRPKSLRESEIGD